jgi:cysteine desulfurase
MTLYLDNNASTPIDPRVLDEMVRCYRENYGNAGSPHVYGERAKAAVQLARDRVVAVVAARRHEVIFTSGATESNNLALLGLAAQGEAIGKRHLVSTKIEHRAVLEPLSELRKRGFDVTLVAPQSDGAVAAQDVLNAIRADTLAVSVMHVNNETGVRQPIAEIAAAMPNAETLLHVDAAQGYGKDLDALRHPRIDLISVSGHKLHGPQGIGALITRRQNGSMPPLRPLMFGGGQEMELRPGTLPVPLIVGLGLAAELASQENAERTEHCQHLKNIFFEHLATIPHVVHGNQNMALPHTLNVSFSGLDAEQVIQALWNVAAISDGSACTSVCASASHVLSAMGVASSALDGAVRLSWSYLTPSNDFHRVAEAIVSQLKMLSSFK